MLPASGRRRGHSHEPTGRVDGVSRPAPAGSTTSGRQRQPQLKRLGIALALTGAALLVLVGFNARLDATVHADNAQELAVVRVDGEATSKDAKSTPGAVAKATERRGLNQQQSEDARQLPLQSESPQPAQPALEPLELEQGEVEEEDEEDEEAEDPRLSQDMEPSLRPDGSRGIILCLHNGIAALGKALIRDLRCMGNRERIQVFHCLPAEMSERSRVILMSVDDNIEIIDVCSALVADGKLSPSQAVKFRGYWIKPLALLYTSLDEVIMLDADALPMRDPAAVRSLPGYQRTGTTFFYDRVIGDRIFFNKVLPGRGNKQMLHDWLETFDYAAFGLSGAQPSPELLGSAAYARRTCHEQDSSMVLIDKRRAGKALNVLWFLVTDKRFKVDFSWGDKEAFWLAFEFAHVPYFFSPWSVSVVSSSPNKDVETHPETLCGSIAHYLPDDGQGASEPELLYVNGKALLQKDPPGGNANARKRTPLHLQYNREPTHVTPRHRRSSLLVHPAPTSNATATGNRPGNLRGVPPKRFPGECLVGLGSTPLSSLFQQRLARRRELLEAIEDGDQEVLGRCGASG